jgi:hypothetical protein
VVRKTLVAYVFQKIIRLAGNPARADQSAVGAVNRPLRIAGFMC